MQKALLLLLAFYCVTISVMPCADTCNDFIDHSVTIQTGDSHNCPDEQCSPFCNCTCCATGFIVTPLANFSVTIPFSKQFALQQFNSLLEQSFSIWQPPQLV